MPNDFESSTAPKKGGEAASGAASLSPKDLAMFDRFQIPPELLIEARIQRVTDNEARSDYGIVGSSLKDMTGIVFPYFSPVTGYRTTARLRRDNPEIEDGKETGKYILAFGDGRHLYFPPGAAAKLERLDTPICLVESEKAALALTAWAARLESDLVFLAMGGCYGWRGRIGKEENARGERVDVTGPLSDLSWCNGRKVYVLLDSNVATNPKVCRAREALVAELLKRGCEVLVCDLPIVDGVNGPDDYIAARGNDAMAEVFANAHGDAALPTELSDDALALRFTELHGNNLRYTAALGRWNRFDGTCWKPDETLHVFDLARDVCRQAAASRRKTPIAIRLASSQTVYAVERLARVDRRHAATVAQWDADPWLLNTPGGVVDLRTGKLRPARRGDYMTKITAVAPGGESPLWLSFLERITARDHEQQRFMQRICGYALTGITSEEALFFLHGTGANGKSKFLNTIAGLMGDYARTAPIETFLESKSQHHPTDLAGFKGARLVTAIETGDGRQWAESKIKALTGGDRIAARFMRQDFFEYVPQFKLFVAGNHKPGLRTVDEAVRRRFNLLPFDVTIPVAERDSELGEKLRMEWGGILQWMIEGCLAWQREGLRPPRAVSEATTNYLAAEDVFARWMEDRCDLKATHWTSTSSLFKSWQEWAEASGEFVGSMKRFSQTLESRGLKPKPTSKARGFLGIGLVTGMTDVTDAPIIPVTRVPAVARSNEEDLSHLPQEEGDSEQESDLT
jgi:putative DNA primase/helicase